MADYTLTFARSATKELEKLSPQLAERVLGRIKSLAENPHLPGTIKIQGGANLWRLRVGDYRVIYSIDEKRKAVDIARVRHRRDIYRNL